MNNFSKEERLAWEDVAAGFEDGLTMSKAVSTFTPDMQTMERTNDVIWRPMPQILTTYDGDDQTNNFKDKTQLSVPATIGYKKVAPWTMTPRELRDALQEGTLFKAAKQKIASDINTAVLRVAGLQSSIVIKRTVAATGYDDVALAATAMTEIGVSLDDRNFAISTRDYNGMAGNLASRATMQGKPTNAYENGYVGPVAGFETFMMDTNYRLAAAAGSGITMDTRDTATTNFYNPAATSVGANGESANVDNRFHTITVSSTTGVAAGDAFTVAALDSVHLITKQDTGQLKTFRVVSVDSSTTMTITPPMITNQVANDAAEQYQNCVINTKASNSALVFLNTVAANVNPFWAKDAIQLIPGRHVIPSGAGVDTMQFVTENGIQLVMQKSIDIRTNKIFYRVDSVFGVVCRNTEMCGIALFNQS